MIVEDVCCGKRDLGEFCNGVMKKVDIVEAIVPTDVGVKCCKLGRHDLRNICEVK